MGVGFLFHSHFQRFQRKNVIRDIVIEDGALWIATNCGLVKYIP